MGRYWKAIMGFFTGGGATAALVMAGMPIEVSTPVVAALVAFMVWLVPNKHRQPANPGG